MNLALYTLIWWCQQGHQFVQQAAANLTLQLKRNIARERKSDKFVDILVRISCLHVAENPKEEIIVVSPKRNLEVGRPGLE